MNEHIINSELNSEMNGLDTDNFVEFKGVKDVQENTNSEYESKKLDEINKEIVFRANLETAIEEHPLYKTLQDALKDTDVSVTIEDVIRNYELISSRDSNEVSQEIISYALGRIGIDISMQENGIVLHSNLEKDKERSEQQAMAGLYSNHVWEQGEGAYAYTLANMMYADREGSSENNVTNRRIDYGNTEVLSIMMKQLYNSSSAPKTEEEYKDALRRMSVKEDFQKSVENSKKNLFINTTQDFYVLRAAVRYSLQLSSPCPDCEKLTGFLEEIRANDQKGEFLNPEDNTVDTAKALAYAQLYIEEATRKGNYQRLKNFNDGETKFAELGSKDQIDLLTSIYALYKQPQSNERIFAMTTLMSFAKDTIVQEGNELKIDENKFLNLFNSTLGEKKRDLKQMDAFITKKNMKDILTSISAIKRKIKAGEFVDIKPPEGLSQAEAEEYTKKAIAEMKEKRKPNLNKSSRKKFENEIKNVMKKNNFEGEPEALIIGAYHTIRKRNEHITFNDKEEEMLKDYILSKPEVFGKYLERGKITNKTLITEENNNKEINTIITSVIKFQKQQDKLEDRKILQKITDVPSFIKDGIKYAGKNAIAWISGNLLKKEKLLGSGEKLTPDTISKLVEAKSEKIDEEHIKAHVNNDKDLMSISELRIMSEDIEKVNSEAKSKNETNEIKETNETKKTKDGNKRNPWELSDEEIAEINKRTAALVANNEALVTNNENSKGNIVSYEEFSTAIDRKEGIASGKIVKFDNAKSQQQAVGNEKSPQVGKNEGMR